MTYHADLFINASDVKKTNQNYIAFLNMQDNKEKNIQIKT